MEALKGIVKREKSTHKRCAIKYFSERFDDAMRNPKVKMMDFDLNCSNNVKSFAVKTRNEIKVTTRFTNGKVLMFAKVSLASLVYDVIDVLCFPDERVQNLHE